MRRVLPFLILLTIGFLCLIFYYSKRPSKPTHENIYGIILPHHGLAKSILNTSFSRLQNSSHPKIIVIFGTNHYFPISSTFTTTQEVKTDYDLKDILADDERIKGDHSIQTLLPYIKNYFPEAKTIPFIISTRYQSLSSLKDATDLLLQRFGDKDILFIASVDFAHNVTLSEGLNKNTESIKNISEFNFSQILNYHDDHMDSPVSIATFMLTMQSLSATNWQTWYSSHGALITDSLNMEGTSYVVGTFSKTVD
jgi:AmmeMemoRadiSam system protein B